MKRPPPTLQLAALTQAPQAPKPTGSTTPVEETQPLQRSMRSARRRFRAEVGVERRRASVSALWHGADRAEEFEAQGLDLKERRLHSEQLTGSENTGHG